ncbi:glycosyltransferase family A protein [Cryomorphaceae bacterium 1068]|nr:glycosyltransferase family A protein [Cryomorphaceae bacterium 1068]
MSKPIVSIITPNFNKGQFVEDCIRSVMGQTMLDWELLFVDDFSTDGSDELAKNLSVIDERVIYQQNQGKKGASSCRNQGLASAKGEYVMFLDSDDLLTPDCLERRVKTMRANPELDYAVYPMGLFHTKLGDSDIICNIPTDETPLNRFLNRDIVWLIAGPIWKKSVLDELGGFDDSLHSQQDYDLHVRALIADFSYKYFHVEPDVFYRQEVHSLPRLQSQTVEHFQFRFEMILHHAELLEKAGKLGEEKKLLLSRYLLDLAQMMRWHIGELGKEARECGLEYWQAAKDRNLVDENRYKLGVKYIRFKHNMKWNRLPKAQRALEKFYRSHLGDLIFYPSKTYCKVTLADYAG